MKRSLGVIVFFFAIQVFGFEPSASPSPVAMPNLRVEVSLKKTGTRETRSGNATTWSSQTSRAISILVDYWFGGEVLHPYQIQCFFFAKNEEGPRTPFVYDCVIEKSQDRTGKKEICAAALEGTKTDWENKSVVDSAGNPGSFTFVDQTAGKKVYGWLVRFVDESGKVFYRDASKPDLLEAEKKDPAVFDKIATKRLELGRKK